MPNGLQSRGPLRRQNGTLFRRHRHATNGDLYGTTYSEGAHGFGTIFRIAPSGTLATLYSFCSQGGCSDGVYPEAGEVQATNGNL